MRLVFVTCLALSGCAGCDDRTFVYGKVSLGETVWARDYATLEVRGYVWSGYDGDPVETEPTYLGSFPTAEIRFPYDYFMNETHAPDGGTVFIHAWLAREPHAPGAMRGEPFDTTVGVLCGCASETPDFVEDADLTLDEFVE